MNSEKDNWGEFVRCCEKYPSVIFVMITDFAEMFFKTSLFNKEEDNLKLEEELMLFAYSFIRKNRYLDDESAIEIEKIYNHEYERVTGVKQAFDTKKICTSDDIAAYCYQYCTYNLYEDWKNIETQPKNIRTLLLSIKVPEYLRQLEENNVFSEKNFINNYFTKFPKIPEQKNNILKLFEISECGNITRDELFNCVISNSSWPVNTKPFWYTRYINKINNADKMILLCLLKLYKRWEKYSVLNKYYGIDFNGTTEDFTDENIKDFSVFIDKKDFFVLFEDSRFKQNLDKKIRNIMKTEKISMKKNLIDDYKDSYTYDWILGYSIEPENVILVLNPLVLVRIFNGNTDFERTVIKRKQRKSLIKKIINFLYEPISFKVRLLMPVITGLVLGTSFIRITLSLFREGFVNLMGENMFNIFNKVFNAYAPVSYLFGMIMMIIAFFNF